MRRRSRKEKSLLLHKHGDHLTGAPMSRISCQRWTAVKGKYRFFLSAEYGTKAGKPILAGVDIRIQRRASTTMRDKRTEVLLQLLSKGVTSLLEKGMTADELVDEYLLNRAFAPAGVLDEYTAELSRCQSVLDWAGRIIAIHFCDRDELDERL